MTWVGSCLTRIQRPTWLPYPAESSGVVQVPPHATEPHDAIFHYFLPQLSNNCLARLCIKKKKCIKNIFDKMKMKSFGPLVDEQFMSKHHGLGVVGYREQWSCGWNNHFAEEGSKAFCPIFKIHSHYSSELPQLVETKVQQPDSPNLPSLCEWSRQNEDIFNNSFTC